MDKIHLMYLQLILGIKTSSSNIITLEECGSIPPSVTIQAIFNVFNANPGTARKFYMEANI